MWLPYNISRIIDQAVTKIFAVHEILPKQITPPIIIELRKCSYCYSLNNSDDNSGFSHRPLYKFLNILGFQWKIYKEILPTHKRLASHSRVWILTIPPSRLQHATLSTREHQVLPRALKHPWNPRRARILEKDALEHRESIGVFWLSLPRDVPFYINARLETEEKCTRDFPRSFAAASWCAASLWDGTFLKIRAKVDWR